MNAHETMLRKTIGGRGTIGDLIARAGGWGGRGRVGGDVIEESRDCSQPIRAMTL